MELNIQDIWLDPESEQFRTQICLGLAEFNPAMLKAKAEFFSDILDGIAKIIQAKEAEIEEMYIAYPIEPTSGKVPIGPTVKYVSSREIQKKLLDRAFPKEK